MPEYVFVTIVTMFGMAVGFVFGFLSALYLVHDIGPKF